MAQQNSQAVRDAVVERATPFRPSPAIHPAKAFAMITSYLGFAVLVLLLTSRLWLA
jgi:hypothetical protein